MSTELPVPPAAEHGARLYLHPDALHYDFGPQHPMRPIRLRALLDLIAALRLNGPLARIEAPPAATRAELELAHDGAYIDVVERLGNEEVSPDEADPTAWEFGLSPGDTPAFTGMDVASAAIAGSTLAAVRSVMSRTTAHAFSPSGGLHHAMRRRGSGFCVYNDIVVGIAAAAREFGARVLYLDFDAHHGDGVQAAFYSDPRVLTCSFHETGRHLFPGTGWIEEQGDGRARGYAINLPLSPFTQDESWLAAVNEIVPELFERFHPDLVVSQHGADGHAWDPLTHLAITLTAFREQTALVHALAHRYCAGRWVACGGGGYQPLTVVPRAWAAVWAEMTGAGVPERVPADWIARWQALSADEIPARFDDPPDAFPTIPRRAAIEDENAATVQRALAIVRQYVRSD